jgi:hypothetical protein
MALKFQKSAVTAAPPELFAPQLHSQNLMGLKDATHTTSPNYVQLTLLMIDQGS